MAFNPFLALPDGLGEEGGEEGEVENPALPNVTRGSVAGLG